MHCLLLEMHVPATIETNSALLFIYRSAKQSYLAWCLAQLAELFI